MQTGKITTKADVEIFLTGFKEKLKVFDIIYEERTKNKQALLDLEITPSQRTGYIKGLKAEDYFKGPTKDTNDITNPDYWKFGKSINNKEVYIKIHFGKTNKPVICISFHVAEWPITYKFK
jgi:hypothetical protein